jgi:tryptophan-rich sensory protein
MLSLSHSLILVPQVLSLLIQFLFPSDFTTNKKVFFQPPGFVFGIVWTLIYILLGFYLYLLVQQRKSNKHFAYMLTIFVFNLLFNFSWTPIVNNQKKYKVGIFLIALMIFTLLLLISIDTKPVNRSLLIPYLSWLFLALLLNVELARNST